MSEYVSAGLTRFRRRSLAAAPTRRCFIRGLQASDSHGASQHVRVQQGESRRLDFWPACLFLGASGSAARCQIWRGIDIGVRANDRDPLNRTIPAAPDCMIESASGSGTLQARRQRMSALPQLEQITRLRQRPSLPCHDRPATRGVELSPRTDRLICGAGTRHNAQCLTQGSVVEYRKLLCGKTKPGLPKVEGKA